MSGPRRVHLFIAGRPFRERALVAAAERGYRTTVPQGARPSLLLYLDVPEGGVDVNVHPAKLEVQRQHENQREGRRHGREDDAAGRADERRRGASERTEFP